MASELRVEDHSIAQTALRSYSDALAKYVATDYARPSEFVRRGIAHEARCFYEEAGEVPAGVIRALDKLEASGTFLRVSHQPNLFCPLNVAALPIANVRGAAMTRGAFSQEYASIFLFIDYDDAGDQRFRTAQLAAWSDNDVDGIVRLTGAVPKKAHGQVAMALPGPPPNLVAKWGQSLQAAALHIASIVYGKDRRRRAIARGTAREHISAIQRTFSDASSLTDASLRLYAWLLNSRWGSNTVCVPASRVLLRLAPAIREFVLTLLEDGAESGVRSAIRDDLYWRVCDTCLARNPVRLLASRGELVACWDCRRCDRTGRHDSVSLSETLPIGLGRGRLPAFLPRVLTCDGIDLAVYRSAGAASYAGSIDHLVRTRLAAARATKPLPPEFVWEPGNLIETIGLGDSGALNRRLRPEGAALLASGKVPSMIYDCCSSGLADGEWIDAASLRAATRTGFPEDVGASCVR